MFSKHFVGICTAANMSQTVLTPTRHPVSSIFRTNSRSILPPPQCFSSRFRFRCPTSTTSRNIYSSKPLSNFRNSRLYLFTVGTQLRLAKTISVPCLRVHKLPAARYPRSAKRRLRPPLALSSNSVLMPKSTDSFRHPGPRCDCADSSADATSSASSPATSFREP